MSETNHMSKSWCIDRHPTDVTHFGVTTEMFIIEAVVDDDDEGDGCFVALCLADTPKTAQLIAAIPHMLAALHSAADYASAAANQAPYPFNRTPLAEIEAAIAEATGEPSP